MFCNKCGKENADQTKFCVQCGARLNTTPQTSVNVQNTVNAEYTAGGELVSAGVKKAAAIVAALVLAAIACVSILKVQLGVATVSSKYELREANGTASVVETDSYIYYSGDAFYRLDKASNRVSKLSDKYIIPVTSTGSAVYAFDTDNNCYKISDKSSELKKVDGINSYGVPEQIFFDGKRHYTVSSNGAITRRINSDKYSGYTDMIYAGESGYTLYRAEKYKRHIYMLLLNSSGKKEFVRVSLKNGKKEQLTNREISSFSFSDNRIVCNASSGGFFAVDLDGGSEKDYSSVDSVKNASLICANGYAYYTDNGKWKKFSVNGSSAEEVGDSRYGLTEINGGFVQATGKKLMIIDYNGKETTSFSP